MRRSEVIHFRLTPAENAAIRAGAERANMTVSEFILAAVMPATQNASAAPAQPRLRPEATSAPTIVCGFRNPQVPAQKCTSEAGHPGDHTYA